MFAYCLNNPVCRMDRGGTRSGILEHEDFGQASAKGGGGSIGIVFPIIIPAPSQPEYELTATEIAAMEAFIAQKQEKAKEEAIAVAATVSIDDTVLFYGIDLRGNIWNVVTIPMDFETAVVWVVATATAHILGKRAKWGLYTNKQEDALKMATVLGGAEPCWHCGNAGEYSHYHTAGMCLFGEYKHFHIWYGEINGG